MQLVRNVAYVLMGNLVPPLKGVDADELVNGSWIDDTNLNERHFKRALIVLKKKSFAIRSHAYPYRKIGGSHYCCSKSKTKLEDTYKLRMKFALGHIDFQKANDGNIVTCNLLCIAIRELHGERSQKNDSKCRDEK